VFRLTPPSLKAALAAACGMDGTLVIGFDAALAAQSAEDFVAETLVRRLGIRHAATGYDFHFGHMRRGTPEFLRDAGAPHGFGVTIVGELSDGGSAVSSTRIRAALGGGDLDAANHLLGWTWGLAGTVQGGDKRGRDLGYPTANMATDPSCGLAHGIYAVRYVRPDGRVQDGVANYGRRPTFDDGQPLLETFLFDFAGNLYGETGLVSLVARFREERRFDSVEALVTQMDADSIEARAILERTPQNAMDRRIAGAFAALASSSLAAGARVETAE
jgi:riboflavin kinase/FMN adenylyltransferase